MFLTIGYIINYWLLFSLWCSTKGHSQKFFPGEKKIYIPTPSWATKPFTNSNR